MLYGTQGGGSGPRKGWQGGVERGALDGSQKQELEGVEVSRGGLVQVRWTVEGGGACTAQGWAVI